MRVFDSCKLRVSVCSGTMVCSIDDYFPALGALSLLPPSGVVVWSEPVTATELGPGLRATDMPLCRCAVR